MTKQILETMLKQGDNLEYKGYTTVVKGGIGSVPYFGYLDKDGEKVPISLFTSETLANFINAFHDKVEEKLKNDAIDAQMEKYKNRKDDENVLTISHVRIYDRIQKMIVNKAKTLIPTVDPDVDMSTYTPELANVNIDTANDKVTINWVIDNKMGYLRNGQVVTDVNQFLS